MQFNSMLQVPVADYRLAHEVFSYEGREEEKRACYSFCMCPGGQIVPTSVNAEELCVNGTYCTALFVHNQSEIALHYLLLQLYFQLTIV